MAIFNSGSGQTNVPSATTIIAHSTALKGDIQLKCNLHIDGEVEGTIRTTGNVVIGKGGVVIGEITAGSVSISGRLEGTVNADNMELLEGGKLFGKVTAKGLVIEPSAVFEGESRLRVEHAELGAGEVTAIPADKKDAKLTAV